MKYFFRKKGNSYKFKLITEEEPKSRTAIEDLQSPQLPPTNKVSTHLNKHNVRFQLFFPIF